MCPSIWVCVSRITCGCDAHTNPSDGGFRLVWRRAGRPTVEDYTATASICPGGLGDRRSAAARTYVARTYATDTEMSAFRNDAGSPPRLCRSEICQLISVLVCRLIRPALSGETATPAGERSILHHLQTGSTEIDQLPTRSRVDHIVV
jgi:hypothetical protein